MRAPSGWRGSPRTSGSSSASATARRPSWPTRSTSSPCRTWACPSSTTPPARRWPSSASAGQHTHQSPTPTHTLTHTHTPPHTHTHTHTHTRTHPHTHRRTHIRTHKHTLHHRPVKGFLIHSNWNPVDTRPRYIFSWVCESCALKCEDTQADSRKWKKKKRTAEQEILC